MFYLRLGVTGFLDKTSETVVFITPYKLSPEYLETRFDGVCFELTNKKISRLTMNLIR